MPTLTIKKLPAKLHARLKRQAAAHRRSLNQEAIECLDKSLPAEPMSSEELLARIRARREANKQLFITERQLRAAKNWGRP